MSLSTLDTIPDAIPDAIKEQLIELECALHKPQYRRDPRFLEQTLHPDFTEFGRSGRHYSRQEIIEEIQSISELPVITTSHFELQVLAKDVFLLTYLSSVLGDNAQLCRRTLRSSIWTKVGSHFQLRFHQGTATD
jgi:ribonuclease HI